MDSIKQGVKPGKCYPRPAHSFLITKSYLDREIKESEYIKIGHRVPDNTVAKCLCARNSPKFMCWRIYDGTLEPKGENYLAFDYRTNMLLGLSNKSKITVQELDILVSSGEY